MKTLAINNYNNQYQIRSKKSPSFTQSKDNSNEMPTKKKAVVLASATAGMLTSVGFLAKRKGFSINPVKIFKTPIKEWPLFKYAPKDKSIQYEEFEIITVASGSIAGGYIGGSLIDDKSNQKAKQREILNQILGNILVPVACVGLGSRVYSKYAEKIENGMPQLKSESKFAKGFNKVVTKLPNAGFTLLFLGIGIYCGNKVSNLINDKLHKKKEERNIKITDFAPHIDDVCMATSMMNKESSFGSKLGRVIPFALLVPGYETGTAHQ